MVNLKREKVTEEEEEEKLARLSTNKWVFTRQTRTLFACCNVTDHRVIADAADFF